MGFVATCLAIGLVAGTLGGLLGVGGGIVMVPAFLRFLGLPAQTAIGTSMVAIIFVSVSASIRHYQLGNVDLKILAMVALATIAGGYLGASLVGFLSEKVLRLVFASFLLYVSVDMFGKAIRM